MKWCELGSQCELDPGGEGGTSAMGTYWAVPSPPKGHGADPARFPVCCGRPSGKKGVLRAG